MFFRVSAVAVCVLLLIGCQKTQPGPDLNVGFTAPTSAEVKAVDVPFLGVSTGEASFDFLDNPKGCASGFTTITTSRGTLSHMGITTWNWEHCVGLDGELLDGELVLIGASGDEVHATYTGSCGGTPVIGEMITCSTRVAISGGTGRFEAASGTASVSGAIVFEGFDDYAWPGRWELNGTIKY